MNAVLAVQEELRARAALKAMQAPSAATTPATAAIGSTDSRPGAQPGLAASAGAPRTQGV